MYISISSVYTHTHTQVLPAPLTDLVDHSDVGEEMMVLCGGHCFPQSSAVLEVAHQNAQAVQVRMLWRDDLKNGLSHSTKVSLRKNPHLSHVLFLVFFPCNQPTLKYAANSENMVEGVRHTDDSHSAEAVQLFPFHDRPLSTLFRTGAKRSIHAFTLKTQEFYFEEFLGRLHFLTFFIPLNDPSWSKKNFQ